MSMIADIKARKEPKPLTRSQQLRAERKVTPADRAKKVKQERGGRLPTRKEDTWIRRGMSKSGFVEKYDPDEIAAALNRASGVVGWAAGMVGCTPQTIYRYMQKYPELAKIHEELTNGTAAVAHAVVVDAIDEGDLDTSKWYLAKRDKRFQQSDSNVLHTGEVVIRVVYDDSEAVPVGPVIVDPQPQISRALNAG